MAHHGTSSRSRCAARAPGKVPLSVSSAKPDAGPGNALSPRTYSRRLSAAPQRPTKSTRGSASSRRSRRRSRRTRAPSATSSWSRRREAALLLQQPFSSAVWSFPGAPLRPGSVSGLAPSASPASRGRSPGPQANGPVLLFPCGHTFCDACLKQHTSKHANPGKAPCPYCRQPIQSKARGGSGARPRGAVRMCSGWNPAHAALPEPRGPGAPVCGPRAGEERRFGADHLQLRGEEGAPAGPRGRGALRRGRRGTGPGERVPARRPAWDPPGPRLLLRRYPRAGAAPSTIAPPYPSPPPARASPMRAGPRLRARLLRETPGPGETPMGGTNWTSSSSARPAPTCSLAVVSPGGGGADPRMPRPQVHAAAAAHLDAVPDPRKRAGGVAAGAAAARGEGHRRARRARCALHGPAVPSAVVRRR